MRTEISDRKRKYPIGAEVVADKGVHFRLWAPKADEVTPVLKVSPAASQRTASMTGEAGGYWIAMWVMQGQAACMDFS